MRRPVIILLDSVVSGCVLNGGSHGVTVKPSEAHATGRDAGVAAAMLLSGQASDNSALRRELVRLSSGLQSLEVARLREKLGLLAGEYFGPVTKKKLAERQTQQGQPSDGIYAPELDTLWNRSVFQAANG